MRKTTAALAVAGCIGAGAIGGAAIAGSGPTNDPQPQTQARAIGGAEAPNARLAALIDQAGGVVRSKGVRAIQHPEPGVFCIRPKGSANIDVTRVVPSVTVDWSNSSGDALMAFYRSSGFGCSANRITVLTVRGEDGTFDVEDGVAFTVVVP